jgi:hypothetical protein
MDFQNQNIRMNERTAVITNLMKGIQISGSWRLQKYTTYAESHPKSYINFLLRDGKRP